MRILLFVSFSAVLLAADPKPQSAPKLSDDQVRTMNDFAQTSRISQLERQVAELRDTIARQGQMLVLYEACWSHGIPKAQCEPQPDGSLMKPPAEPKKTEPAKPAPPK